MFGGRRRSAFALGSQTSESYLDFAKILARLGQVRGAPSTPATAS